MRKPGGSGIIALQACLAIVGACSLPTAALAAFVTSAVDNSTVQPGGPRTGVNGQRFFNVEGSTNGAFADFGVIVLTPSGATLGPGPVGLSLTLTESNAAFSTTGGLQFYLTTDTTTNIDAGTSPLIYDATNLPAGLGSQLTTKYLLGVGTFTPVSTGTQDRFSFLPSGPALSYLINQVNLNGRIRLIIAPADPTVAATYSGFANTSPGTPGPQLAVTNIPEPSTSAFTVAGLLFALGYVCSTSRRRA